MVLENFGFPAHDSKRQLTVEQKLEAIRRVTDFGETKASVSRMFGVPESTLRGWCKNKEKLRLLSISKKQSSTGSRSSKSERDEGRYGELLTSSGPPATPESTSASNESTEYYGGYLNERAPSSPPMAHANSSPYSAPVSGPAPALDLTRLITMYCSQATANHQNPVSLYSQYEQRPDYNEEPLSLVKKPQDCQPDSSLVEDSSGSHDIDHEAVDRIDVEESTVKAIHHGEQFLRWLETVSDPSITRLQLLQFRSLLDRVKAASFNRKIKSMDRPIETAQDANLISTPIKSDPC